LRDLIFVTGTDTGVGKTVLSLILMQYFFRKGKRPFYLKPAQTGCADPYDTDSDARFIYGHIQQLSGQNPADSVILCFKNPKAPFFAARDEGKVLDMEKVFKVISDRHRTSDPLIVEAAGGLMVPMTDQMLVADFIKLLNARPLLAARAGLGTINHTLLSVESLRARGIQPAGIVFMDSGPSPTNAEMISENIEAVRQFSGITVAGTIGAIGDFSNPGDDCFRPLEKIYG
jgi:dethiobiotin synthetase